MSDLNGFEDFTAQNKCASTLKAITANNIGSTNANMSSSDDHADYGRESRAAKFLETENVIEKVAEQARSTPSRIFKSQTP